ncbi:Gfo/Idh/MocA family protein [Jiangella anatolica]|uniref:Gfo/Idh/MocA family oxidoreductase n=1 Tax=Jiangella anatolica TaxID=2670374 RepID=A0A2W2CCB5_9ACTN|nr:Gfo/Idh/MocA family oxidoreductase [Jiangella anatolica]PZF85859.1 hypothetical protein C1I92_02965 [Jiangella anatolica]
MESSSGYDRPVGVLVVGTGAIAELHLAAVHAHPGATLAGVADLVPVRAAAAARAHGGVPWDTDLATALARPGVDAVIACPPNDAHAEVGLAVAAAGKHLLIEKPLATTVDDADRLVAAFADHGLTLTAAHTHRHYDYARAVHAAIADGTVGRPRLIRLSVLGGWIWPDWRAWVLDPARSGGHELHNGVHLLDLVTWWMGDDPVRVYARGRKQTAAELEIHDYLELVVEFAGGGVAVCEMSRGHRPATLGYRDVLVVGDGGSYAIPWDGAAATLFGEAGTALLPVAESDGFATQLDAWLTAIRGGPDPMPATDAARAVVLAVAARESIATGAPVEVMAA